MPKSFEDAVKEIKSRPYFVKVFGKGQVTYIPGEPLEIDDPATIAGVYNPHSETYSEEQVAYDIAMMGG